jgi:hypothetical protein
MPAVQDAKDYKMLTAAKDHKDQQQGLIHLPKILRTAVLERTLTAVLQFKMPAVQNAKDYKMLTATKDHKDQQQGLIHQIVPN